MTRRAVEPVTTRIHRLLAMLQHVAAHPDGVLVTDLADRFGVDVEAVGAELAMAQMVGGDSPDYDDMPFDVFVDGDRVHATLFSFEKPLRLTVDEGLALLASADALLGREQGAGDADGPGGDGEDTPLARALTKLSAALGLDDVEALDVDVDPDGGALGRDLRRAVEERRRVRFNYWSYARDVVSDRLVEPWRVYDEAGSWYLVGLDVDKDAERRFRLDRVGTWEVTDEPAGRRPRSVSVDVEIPDDAPQVVLDLPAEAAWVVEAYPVVASRPGEDGRLEVTLAVAGCSWLERLLLRLGPAARVVHLDPELGGPGLLAEVATRVLARYA